MDYRERACTLRSCKLVYVLSQTTKRASGE